MGAVGSTIYRHGKRWLIRYNAENRVHKFLDKGSLPLAPKHPLARKPQKVELSRDALEDIHCKNPQLDEYLKKVYLTSTSQITGTPSTRPKPKKENERLKVQMFYEPKTPSSGRCTLTNVVEILLNHQEDSDKWSASAITHNYNLDKKDVVNLIMYYSLFKLERFEFMNVTPEDVKEEVVEFEVCSQLEKKPVKQIDSK